MILPFFSPLAYFSGIAGPEETKNQRGNVLRLIQARLATASLQKFSRGCQCKKVRRIALS